MAVSVSMIGGAVRLASGEGGIALAVGVSVGVSVGMSVSGGHWNRFTGASTQAPGPEQTRRLTTPSDGPWQTTIWRPSKVESRRVDVKVKDQRRASGDLIIQNKCSDKK